MWGLPSLRKDVLGVMVDAQSRIRGILGPLELQDGSKINLREHSEETSRSLVRILNCSHSGILTWRALKQMKLNAQTLTETIGDKIFDDKNQYDSLMIYDKSALQ
jgi:hypothetical protein